MAQERRQSAQESPKTAREGPRRQPVRLKRGGPLFDEFAPGLPWCWGTRSPSMGPEGPRRQRRRPSSARCSTSLPQICRGAGASEACRRAQEPRDSPKTRPRRLPRLQGFLTAQRRPPDGPKEPNDGSRKPRGAAEKAQKGTLFSQTAGCWGAPSVSGDRRKPQYSPKGCPRRPPDPKSASRQPKGIPLVL